jgi:protein CpxP
MEKTKLLTIAVIGLLFINLATLGISFLNGSKGSRPNRERGPEPKTIIIEKLDFDANQQKDYAKFINWHRGEITRLDSTIRPTKNELYMQLNQTEVSVKTKDSLILLLNSYQKQVEETHFKHFEDIKSLCHQDQMEDFKELTKELSRIFVTKPRGLRHD